MFITQLHNCMHILIFNTFRAYIVAFGTQLHTYFKVKYLFSKIKMTAFHGQARNCLTL